GGRIPGPPLRTSSLHLQRRFTQGGPNVNSDAKAPRLAVTMGDPAGIGPEIILKALADPQIRQSLRPLVVGDPQVMQQTAQRLNLDLPVRALPPLPASGDLSGSPVEAWAAEPDDGRTLAVVQGSQQPAAEEIGRASCRDRSYNSVFAGVLM